MPSLTMPNVGEGVTEGTVTRWLKQEGDAVALDEPVVEIETDKAVVEIPSPFEGTLAKIIVQEGSVVPIGAPLAEFAAAGATAEPASTAAADDARADEPARATVGAEAGKSRGADGASKSSRVRDGRSANGATPGAPTTGEGFRRTRQYSPVVLKLAAEHNIDLALVRGSGIDGRVTRQDVLAYLENPMMHMVPPGEGEGVVGAQQKQGAEPARARPRVPEAAAPTPEPEAPPAAKESATVRDGDERIALTATRRTIASRMLQSHQTVPVAWMMVEADVTGLVGLRARLKDEFRRREGVALTYMPFFVHSIVGAMKSHPEINATFDEDAIIVHHRYHIGIAVAAESGLVVPVIRDPDRKSIAGLSHELDELGTKARQRKLSVDEMRGATFTIDNTGAFGSIVSQPIIPPGQAAIITTEAIRREVRATDDGLFGVRSVMNLCVSFDHRALDGAQAGIFMRDVRLALEAIRADQAVY
jgi:2-oxoisovalerate dehydrogenase E2 component (dihydrolipoyl transacylase)